MIIMVAGTPRVQGPSPHTEMSPLLGTEHHTLHGLA